MSSFDTVCWDVECLPNGNEISRAFSPNTWRVGKETGFDHWYLEFGICL
jgi:hypothetical protein